MANPIVAFFDPDKRPTHMVRALPLGWTLDDRLVDPLVEAEHCQLLLLDDRSPVPSGLLHSNRVPAATLGVIWHLNSLVNTAPEQDPNLQILGRAKIITGFHHVDPDDTFKALSELIAGKAKASQLCADWNAQAEHEALTEMAMLCQQKLLDPDAVIEAECRTLLSSSPHRLHRKLERWLEYPSPVWQREIEDLVFVVNRLENAR